MKIFTYASLLLLTLVSVSNVAVARIYEIPATIPHYYVQNSANGGWDYEYPEVRISASPQVVEVNGRVRVTWDSVFATPYATPSSRAYRELEYGPVCELYRTNSDGTEKILSGGVTATKGAFYDTVTGTSEITYKIRCRANTERSGCADSHFMDNAIFSGPDSICRTVEYWGDKSNDHAAWYYSTASVTPTYPDEPVVASCAVSPATAQTNTEVTWSATGTGGGSYKKVPNAGVWKSYRNLACLDGVPSCGDNPPNIGSRCATETDTECSPDAEFSCSIDDGGGLLDNQSAGIGPSAISVDSKRYTLYRCSPATVYDFTAPNYTFNWTGTDGLTGTTDTLKKLYSTEGIKEGTVTITAGNGQASKTCQMTVTAALQTTPDLTASTITPNTATEGTAVTLSTTITNSGAASTGASFTNLFQRATDSSGTGSTDIGTHSNATLAASANNAATISYTFPSAGTYYVRACADKSSAGNSGSIAETDETNNCSAWTAITVSPVGPQAPTCTFSASPTNSVPSTLTWSSTNATSCIGGGFLVNSTSGSRTVNTVGTYTISCTGAGGTCTQSVSIGGGTCTGPAVPTITASPTRVRAGQTTTLTWNAAQVPGSSPACTISGPGISQTVPAGAPPTCAIPTGTATPVINSQSTYTITCGGTSAQTVVNVIPKFQEF